MLGNHPFWATIPVADMERAKAFYCGLLGLVAVKETDQWVTLRSGDTWFQLYPTPSAGKAQHTLGGWFVDDLEALVAEMRAQGVEFEEYDFPGLVTTDGIAELGVVEKAAWFRDSEGNIIAVSQFLTDPTG